MKRILLLLTSFCFLALLLIVSALNILAQSSRFQGKKEFLQFTQNLPAVDKVELLKLKTNGDLWNGEIEASKILTGIAAKSVASLWRNQVYKPYTAACHNPIYGIKFYSKEKLIVYASVCWDCNNIALETPYINDTQYFDGRGKKGQQLLQIFRAQFPENK